MDPNVSRNTVKFHFREGAYRVDPSLNHLAVHFHMEGNLVHESSEEAKELAALLGLNREKETLTAAQIAAAAMGADLDLKTSTSAQVGASELGGTSEDFSFSTSTSTSASGVGQKPPKPVKSQFNFTERVAQTFNNPLRERKVVTEPPPRQETSGEVTQWSIFDAYLQDYLQQLAARDQKDNPRSKKDDQPDASAGPSAGSTSSGIATSDSKALVTDTLRVRDTDADPKKQALEAIFQSPAMAKALKIMERTVSQTSLANTFWSFKYQEEVPNESKDNHGFLPLWTFESKERKTVTALSWNKTYTDLFAVGYGSYDCMVNAKHNVTGTINCFSLKNSSNPEATFKTPSSVMCLDWHPNHPSLLVAGLHDGTVCVFDVRVSKSDPIFSSTDPNTKHTGPVWEVGWNEDPVALNFYSLSSDGRLVNWVVNKNDLDRNESIVLKFQPRADENAGSDSTLVSRSGGTCFDFNTTLDMLVIGTEDGGISTYNMAYNSKFSMAFDGHSMAVYSVKWNQFHPTIFISGSADWTIKLWEYTTRNPIMTFDMQYPVSDVMWSPFKSTVFASVTSGDGYLKLFDLAVNKNDAIGETKPSPSVSKLSHLAFNPKEPVIAVSDHSGVVHVLKIAKSIRRMNAPKIEELDPLTEQALLEQVLIIQDEFGNNKVTKSIPPKMAQKKLEERLAAEKKAAEAAAAKRAEQDAED